MWRVNDYPYYLVDGIQMDVVWCEAGSITEGALQVSRYNGAEDGLTRVPLGMC